MLEAGVPENTPVALVQNGSRTNQQVWRSQVKGCGRLSVIIDTDLGPTLVIS